MDRKYRILWISDSPMIPTGYANQSRAICSHLARNDELDVNYLGCQYHGMPAWVKHRPNRFYGTNVSGSYKLLGAGDKAYGEGIIPRYLKRDVQPDLTCVLLDSFMLHWTVDPNKWGGGTMNFGPSKWMFYFPSDGEPVPLGFDRIMSKMNYKVAMARWGQKQAIGMGFKNCLHIPHGVDESEFYPLSKNDKLGVRARYGLSSEDFVVLSVFRNQGRKMTTRLIKAWAKFVGRVGKRGVKLLLHSDPRDRAAPTDLNHLAKELGVFDTIMWSGMSIVNPFSVEELNELYNMADLHVLSTSGEGFGIPIVESMATGTPNLLPDFTTPRELLLGEKYGYLAKLSTKMVGSYMVERGIVDVDDFAKKLEFCFNNRVEVRKKGLRAVRHVRDNYSWRTILPKWSDLIDRVRFEK